MAEVSAEYMLQRLFFLNQGQVLLNVTAIGTIVGLRMNIFGSIPYH